MMMCIWYAPDNFRENVLHSFGTDLSRVQGRRAGLNILYGECFLPIIAVGYRELTVPRRQLTEN